MLTAQHDNLINVDGDLQLLRLEDSVYVHITWHRLEQVGRFPSNGLIMIKNGQALMIDTIGIYSSIKQQLTKWPSFEKFRIGRFSYCSEKLLLRSKILFYFE
jgi:hypothetical protein